MAAEATGTAVSKFWLRIMTWRPIRLKPLDLHNSWYSEKQGLELAGIFSHSSVSGRSEHQSNGRKRSSCTSPTLAPAFRAAKTLSTVFQVPHCMLPEDESESSGPYFCPDELLRTKSIGSWKGKERGKQNYLVKTQYFLTSSSRYSL